MHQRQRRGERGIGQVGIERLQLSRGQHSLVDQRACGERGEVDAKFMFGALAKRVHNSIKLYALQLNSDSTLCRDEQLPERRHNAACRLPHERWINRHFTPAQDVDRLFARDALDGLAGGSCGSRIGGQEGNANRIGAGFGEVEGHVGTQERIGNLHEDPGSITTVGLCARRTAMLKVAKGRERLVDNVMGRVTGQRGDEGHAAGITLASSVVQTLRCRLGGGRENASLGRLTGIHGYSSRRRQRPEEPVGRDVVGPRPQTLPELGP